jgi:hypothetical protein
LAIGSDFSFVNSKISDKNTPEAKTNNFRWFPFASAFEATEQYKFYAGIDGGVQLNSYANLLQQNPFLVSDLVLKPTETKYHFYFGLKGDIDQELKYDVKAGFSDLKNAQFSERMICLIIITRLIVLLIILRIISRLFMMTEL